MVRFGWIGSPSVEKKESQNEDGRTAQPPPEGTTPFSLGQGCLDPFPDMIARLGPAVIPRQRLLEDPADLFVLLIDMVEVLHQGLILLTCTGTLDCIQWRALYNWVLEVLAVIPSMSAISSWL